MNKIIYTTMIVLIALTTMPCNGAPLDADSLKRNLADSISTTQPAKRRFITPVTAKTNVVLPPGKDVSDEIIEQYITGDTAKALIEAKRDSLRKAYTHYPRLNDLAIGFNFIDLVLAAAGQKHFNVDLSLTLNMWNRLQPVIELGIGKAKSTPDDMNFTYNGKISPFARLGVNYNFMFKNNPNFQALVGARLGGSIFKYDITNIQHSNGYWGESTTTSIPQQSSQALWYEIVGGLKVKILRNFSLGWFVKFHNLISEKKNEAGQAWFIPGYGTRNGSLAFSFSAYYTLPFHQKTTQETETSIAEVK